MLTGKNLIAGQAVDAVDGTFTAGGSLATFEEASSALVNRAVDAAAAAFDEYRRLPKLRAMQDGRALSTKRTLWPAAPGRVFRAPWSLVANADQAGGDVTVSFA